MIHEDGTIYSGEYINAKRNGKGKLHHPENYDYEGEFYEDQLNGYGVMTKTHGKGKGNKYVGQFEANEKHGKGVYY